MGWLTESRLTALPWEREHGGAWRGSRFFAALLAALARTVGAGRARHVALALDNAGWHDPKGLAVPDRVTLVFLPPCSPEPQPAQRLWSLANEPVANRHFATLGELDATMIKPHINFHR